MLRCLWDGAYKKIHCRLSKRVAHEVAAAGVYSCYRNCPIDCQVRVRGAPSNVYGVNVTKAVIGAYM